MSASSKLALQGNAGALVPRCSCWTRSRPIVVAAAPSSSGNRRRGIPAAAAAAAERTASRQVTVDITKTSLTSRKINAAISIAAPVEVVWSALTDYDNLGTFIPGLVENKCLQRYRAGCKLYQQSAQDVALGVKFAAGVTLEIQEYPAGLPAHLCAEEGLHDYERYFPCPSGFTLAGQPYSDISFALLEGDFAAFKGVWRLQNVDDPDSMQLNYAVFVKPMPWLPVGLIQNRIEKEIITNLRAVQKHAEGLVKRRGTSSSSNGSSMSSLSAQLDE